MGLGRCRHQAALLLKKSAASTLMVFRNCASHFPLEGFMGRFVSLAGISSILLCLILLASCGQSSPTNVTTGNAVPTSVSLTTSSAVGSNVSLEVGKTLALTATARGARDQILSETFS